MKNAARLAKNLLPKLRVALGQVTRREVLVGVPAEETARQDEGKQEMNNATIAYLMDNGCPAANIPERPFMDPGIKRAQKAIVAHFGQAGKRVLTGDASKAEADLHKVGMVAQSAIREVINEGIAPALSKATLQARARRGRKGAATELSRMKELGDEYTPIISNAKPLVDTGQLRNSINYAIRDRKK